MNLSDSATKKAAHSTTQIEIALLQLEIEMAQIGVAYFVIGSCARMAYLEEMRAASDIDILIFGAQSRRRAMPILQRVTAQSGVLVDDSLSRFFALKNGAYFLTYGRLRVPVEAQVFERRTILWGNAKMPTFAPQTLLHFFNCLVATPLRPKDKPNVFRFARFVKTRREFSHDLYLPFHFFARRWRYFPLHRLQSGWRRLLFRYIPPALRAGILISYQTAPSRLIRGVFNNLVPLIFVRFTSPDTKRYSPSNHGGRGCAPVETLMALAFLMLVARLILSAFSCTQIKKNL